jgi:hypothetical protein
MKFISSTTEETVTSGEHLRILVDTALRHKDHFYLGDSDENCLRLTAYANDGPALELHRGNKWRGWIASVSNCDQVGAIFSAYFQNEDLADDLLSGNPKWEEAGFHPIGVILFCVTCRRRSAVLVLCLTA